MAEKIVAIIDADLVNNPKKHRFPNLACMKISAYYKEIGAKVVLKMDYENLDIFDKVTISKVFTSTVVPNEVLSMENVLYGGTGFFYENAKPLPFNIEHIKPDYHLYDEWVEERIKFGESKKALKYYMDYSIGFLTRGCFRKCEFCVNKKYDRCSKHSSVYEFYDEERPKLCFLDDNFLACPEWLDIINEVKGLGKPFQFKQGLDERLLTKDKIKEVFSWKYDGDYIFAFDNIQDKELIESKLKMIYDIFPNFRKNIKFYVLVGFDRNGRYDENFWKQDVKNAFVRIFTLIKYSAVPYIMRYEKCYTCKYSGFYTTLASWCNQVSFFLKMSFETYSKARGMTNDNYKKYKNDFEGYINDGNKKYSTWRYLDELLEEIPKCKNVVKIIPQERCEYGVYKKQNSNRD